MTDAWTGYISIHTNITNRLSICWISALFRIHTHVCPCFCETSHCCVIITVIRGVMSFILFLVLLIRDNCEEYIPFGVLILNLRFAKLLTRSNRRTVSVLGEDLWLPQLLAAYVKSYPAVYFHQTPLLCMWNWSRLQGNKQPDGMMGDLC